MNKDVETMRQELLNYRCYGGAIGNYLEWIRTAPVEDVKLLHNRVFGKGA